MPELRPRRLINSGERGLPCLFLLRATRWVMSEWPRDLFRRAFLGIWENFAYRRMPEVGDFRAFIGDALAERRNRLAKLESMRLRLKTLELREQWDTQSRERHARRETVKSMVVEDAMARRKRVDPTLHQAQNPPHS